MSYLQSVYNNTRYIVFIQTKYHQNIPPANDVSGHSLKMLMKTIGSPRGGNFRSIRIYKDDITTLKIYEMNFINYKENVLKLSKNWIKAYQKFSSMHGILDYILYATIYKSEVNKFGNHITNNKPKYLIDKTEQALKMLYGKRKDYLKNKDGKEIIKAVDCHRGELIINEEVFMLDKEKQAKASYFLEIFTSLVEKEDYPFVDLYDFIEEYENRYYDDGFDGGFLNLDAGHIRKSYITTINNNILKKYDKELLEIKDNQIRIIQDS